MSADPGQFGKLMSRNADHDEIPAAKEYFKAQGGIDLVRVHWICRDLPSDSVLMLGPQ